MIHHTTDPGERAADIADHEFPEAKNWDFVALRDWLNCQEQALREFVEDVTQEAKGAE